MDNTLIPTEWIICKISDIATVNPKKIEADPEATSGFIPMSHAPTDYAGKLEFDEKPWGEIKKSYTNFQNGDVIFAKVTPCFENGKAAVVEGLPNGIGAGSSEFYVLRADAPYFSERLLYALIKTHGFATEGAQNMTGAVGLRRVPRKFVEEYPVSLPPLAEQKVIAEKLDKLLAKVNSIKARLDAVPDTLKRFRQSVLAAAVSGKLTENFVSTSRNLRDIVEFKQGTQVPSPEQVDEQLAGFDRFLRIINFTQGDKDFKYVPTKKSNRIISEDDVVMVRYGATSGFVGRGLAGVLANNLFVISPDESLLSKEYLYKYLTSPTFQGTMKQMLKGGAMPAISFKLFDGIDIDLPSLAIQKGIVTQVEKLFAYADKVEAEVNAVQERVNKLTQSILAKAFRGELTAKWREQNPDLISGDNSAEALLEKIKAEREKLKPTKKRKTK
ncbi:restriction endonuclease subunit S [Candidatus Enterovibrio escicola]|uniref:restriction endonuclease subunit S n=1 Tax=Candidatus Enterovibrio escicola TaxID=1927127 RepID=UPI001238297F|nr:restriction endonuclease subunit S [Candidatus Enterovibrio escacola]